MSAPGQTPRALLISLRDPDDAMALHERRCFAERAALPLGAVEMHFMAEGRPTDQALRRYDALFFGGSGAYSVLDEVAWIRHGMEALLQAVELRIPSWASCFGFQGLALALGGEVVRDPARTEMGSTLLELTEAGRSDPLMGKLPSPFWAQEGHQDHVETLPPGVELLATGTVSHAQAFRVEGAPFWASQFHPELTVERTVERFRFYGEHYLEGEFEKTLKTLAAGEETEELGGLLKDLVWGRF